MKEQGKGSSSIAVIGRNMRMPLEYRYPFPVEKRAGSPTGESTLFFLSQISLLEISFNDNDRRNLNDENNSCFNKRT